MIYVDDGLREGTKENIQQKNPNIHEVLCTWTSLPSPFNLSYRRMFGGGGDGEGILVYGTSCHKYFATAAGMVHKV